MDRGFRCIFRTSSLMSFTSTSLLSSCDDQLLYAGQQLVHSPSTVRRHCALIIALLLILGGVESNPGPAPRVPGVLPSYELRLGVLNVNSAGPKAHKIRELIASQRLDLLVLTETCMSADQSTAVTGTASHHPATVSFTSSGLTAHVAVGSPSSIGVTFASRKSNCNLSPSRSSLWS